MSEGDDLEQSAEVLRVLGHSVRLALLSSLVDGERSVGEIEARTGLRQPALSQQLGILRNAGLVTTRREAKQIFYQIDQDRVRRVRTLLGVFAQKGAEPNAPINGSEYRSSGTAAAFARIG